MMGTLYVVATPIGNLEDISLRALEVLKKVDRVLCEDTRVTRKLLSRYEISTPTESYHAQSSLTKAEKIIAWLEHGSDLALVSDAGTPAISDPGSHLVSLVRERFQNSAKVVSVPGASALASALSISGLPVSDFLFLGFLPHKKGRETLFNEIADSKRTVVFYESKHRIMKTLESLEKILEASASKKKRSVVLARELTKMHEEVLVGSPTELGRILADQPKKQKGEFVVLVAGK